MKLEIKSFDGENLPDIYLVLLFVMFLLICFFSPSIGVIGIVMVAAIHFSDSIKALEKNKMDRPILDERYKQDIPFPYLVLDKNRIVEKSNSLALQAGKSVTDYIAQFDHKVTRQTVFFNEKHYVLLSVPFISAQEGLNIVYFLEQTADEDVSDRNGIAVGLIFIDNHDEVLETVEEVRQQLLLAVIDRKINTLSQKVGGIIKKFEKDKYIWIFSKEKIKYLKEKKFDILDNVREIDMGNSIPVTLSIGLGINGNTLTETMEYARAAVDLALGRGGDQVLIKDHDGYAFFGGKSKEVENNTRVRARVKAYVLTELIQESHNIMIMGHKNADLDCLGSAIGVYKIADAMGKNCNIVLNTVPAAISSLYDKLMQQEHYKDDVFLTSEEALEKITSTTLLIIVDVHKSSLVETPDLLEKTNKIVIIDHHRKSADFIDNAVLTYHEPYASSACELVTEIFLYVKTKIKFKAVEADALLAGITVDTKNFNFKTGARTFEAAAYLRRNGADSARVADFFKHDLRNYKARAAAVSNAEMFRDGIAISTCDSDSDDLVLITAQVADELLKIRNIESSFVLCRAADTVYVSARSLGRMNVQVVLEKFGGGGHQTVAGAQLQEVTLEEARKILENAIEEYLQEES